MNEIVIGMIAGAVLVRRNRLAAEEAERIRQEEIARYHREQRRQARLAKREAFVEAKVKQFERLRQLRAFADHLVTGRPELEAVFESPMARAAQIRSATAAPARMEALFLPHPRGRMHHL